MPNRARHRCGAPALLLVLSACPSSSSEATKVDPEMPVVERPRRPAPRADSPFLHPDREAPAGREGEQVPPAEIEALLAAAAADIAQGRDTPASEQLRRCANKLPASARCDGELGLLLAKVERRRAEAEYYLVQSAEVDDPQASADLYARVGARLREIGRFESAARAFELALARDDSVERRLALARTLQSLPDRLREAADLLGRAYAARPTDPELLFEQATVLGQVQEADAARVAAQLFERYLETAGEIDAERKATTQARIRELRSTGHSPGPDQPRRGKG